MSLHLTKKHSNTHWELAVTSAAGEAKSYHLHHGLGLVGLCQAHATLTRFEFNTWPRIQARQAELNAPGAGLWVALNLSEVPEETVQKLLIMLNRDKQLPLTTLVDGRLRPFPDFDKIAEFLLNQPQPTWMKSELMRWSQNQEPLLRRLAHSLIDLMPGRARAEQKQKVDAAPEDLLIQLIQEWSQDRDLYLLRLYQQNWSTIGLTVDRNEATQQHKDFVAKGETAQLVTLGAVPREERRWRITVTGNALHFRCDVTGAYGLLDAGAFKTREKFFQKVDTSFYQALFSSQLGYVWPIEYNSFVDLLCEEKTFTWGEVWHLCPTPPAPRAAKKLQLTDGDDTHVLSESGDGYYTLPSRLVKKGLLPFLQAGGYFQITDKNSKVKLIDLELRFEMGV